MPRMLLLLWIMMLAVSLAHAQGPETHVMPSLQVPDPVVADATDLGTPPLDPLMGTGATPLTEPPSSLSLEDYLYYRSLIIDPRCTVRYNGGDGVGYDNGFVYLETFLPVHQEPGQTVTYLDTRFVNFQDIRLWQINSGGGCRYLDPTTDRIHGFNIFYDGRNSDLRFYNQLGFGVESLGHYVDFRCNGYLAVGEDSIVVNSGLSRFSGNNIMLDRVAEVALAGLDCEVGVPVPGLQATNTKAYLGYYFYTNDSLPEDANGIRFRLESIVGERVSLHFAVNHDQVFDTTVNGGLALHFGGGRWKRPFDFVERPLVRRLDDRVVRKPNIVLARDDRPDVALSVNGSPVQVRFVRSDGPAGGEGTFENPFATLAEAQAGSSPGDIIFLGAGSVFANEGIILSPGQRLLGEGVPEFFTSTQGTFPLPAFTGGTVLPQITGGIGITESTDNQVSGIILD